MKNKIKLLKNKLSNIEKEKNKSELIKNIYIDNFNNIITENKNYIANIENENKKLKQNIAEIEKDKNDQNDIYKIDSIDKDEEIKILKEKQTEHDAI